MYRIIVYPVVFVVLVWGYVLFLETHSIYYPKKKIQFTPSSIRLAFEDVYVKTSDNVTLHGWFIPCENARYTLLFLHGNAGSLDDRLEKIHILQKLGLNILIIDYRGFGLSQGRPSEKGLYLDARAAYGYLTQSRKITPERILLYGESLGTAVAVDLASTSAVKAIILEGAFSCGKDMAKQFYPFLPGFLFSDTFNSATKIKKAKAALLILHSKDDEVIPIFLARKLFSAAPEQKSFTELKGGHNDAVFVSKHEYAGAIAAFIGKL